MLKLPKQVKKGGKIYRLVKRDGDVAMYNAFTLLGARGEKTEVNTSREVFKVRIQKQTVAPNGKVIPEKEKYPSNEDFGRYAWCFATNTDSAEDKYKQLIAEQNKPSIQKTNAAKLQLSDNIVIRKFANDTVMVNVDKKPVGPKKYLVRAAVELKNISAEHASKMTIKQLTKEIFTT